MSQFELFYGDGLGSWTSIYELSDTDPDNDLHYGGGDNYTAQDYLEIAANVDPITAQYFRAEFTQHAYVQVNAAGPRVLELDGYDTFLPVTTPNPVPEPCTMLLLGTGLVGFAGTGIRKRFRK